MTNPNLNRFIIYKNIVFFTTLIFFCFYLTFLVVASKHVLPGFLMQLMFLFDSLKNGGFLRLTISSSFWLNFIAGLIFFHLLKSLLLGTIKIRKTLVNTYRFLRNIKSFKKNGVNYIDSSLYDTFTSGFVKPKVFISNKLASDLSLLELKSVIAHEKCHQKEYDPLKSFIFDSILSLLPDFPGKTWFKTNYEVLTEISCDQYSYLENHSKTGLVSALIKFHQFNSAKTLFVSGFNSQSSRLRVLVGKEIFRLRSLLFFNFSILTLVFLSTSFVANSSFIFRCTHLLNCFNTYVLSHSINTPVSPSVHCDETSL